MSARLTLHIPEPTTAEIAEAHAHRVVAPCAIRPEAAEAHARCIAAIEEMQKALTALLMFDPVVPGDDRAAVTMRGWNALRNVQREGLPGMVPCPMCASAEGTA